jgi:hypothetical protein
MANFEGLQAFLSCVHSLTSERRLLGYFYVLDNVLCSKIVWVCDRPSQRYELLIAPGASHKPGFGLCRSFLVPPL